jgi:hypothetical protein
MLFYFHLTGFGIIIDNLRRRRSECSKEQKGLVQYLPRHTRGARAFAGIIKCKNGEPGYTFTIASTSWE